MSWIELYLWARMDAINMGAGILLLLSIIGFVITTSFYVFMKIDGYYDDELKVLKPYQKTATICFAVSMVLATAAPTKADLALIYGMHWATNNEDVRALPDEAVKLIREWLNEARPNKGGEQ